MHDYVVVKSAKPVTWMLSANIEVHDQFNYLTLCVRYVVVKVHNSWSDFRGYFEEQVSHHFLLISI